MNTLKECFPREAPQHLPELVFSSTFTPEDLGLPWLGLGLNLGIPKDHPDWVRVLRVLTGKPYGNVWEVGSIEDVKKVWLDCV